MVSDSSATPPGQEKQRIEKNIMQQLRVSAREIRRINQYIQKAEKVSVNGIAPVFRTNPTTLGTSHDLAIQAGMPDNSLHGSIEAFDLSLEGPARHMSYFQKLLAMDNSLKIS